MTSKFLFRWYYNMRYYIKIKIQNSFVESKTIDFILICCKIVQIFTINVLFWIKTLLLGRKISIKMSISLIYNIKEYS